MIREIIHFGSGYSPCDSRSMIVRTDNGFEYWYGFLGCSWERRSSPRVSDGFGPPWADIAETEVPDEVLLAVRLSMAVDEV